MKNNFQIWPANKKGLAIPGLYLCICIAIVNIDQGSQTQILSRAALAIKNVLRAAHQRKNGSAAAFLRRSLSRATYVVKSDYI
jgi:hypothetical protein